MIIQGKGTFRLMTLEPSHLEIIRIWRNSPEIRGFMEYQQDISKKAQTLWFQSIQNDRNYFFLIEFQSKPIGLIQIQNISNGQGESGLFIGDSSYLSTPAPYYASLPLLDFAFSFLNLSKITAKVHKKNQVAIDYNSSLGFTEGKNVNDLFKEYHINNEDFSDTILNNRFFNDLKNSYTLFHPVPDSLNTKSGQFISSVKNLSYEKP